jgi:hypothetical protein
VKRIPELRDLSDDHHTGLVLARRCKQAASAGAEPSAEATWQHVREVFRSDLEPHFQIEERLLVPALEAIGEDALAAQIREDHAALREQRDGGARDPQSLSRFGVLLQSHIRFEEREIFDPVQNRLPKAALEAIAAACREMRD